MILDAMPLDSMMMLSWLAVGAIAGLLAGYLGIGGGLVIVPALIWLFSRDPAMEPLATHYAVATSLATMLLTSLSSILAHQRRRAIDWSVVRMLTPGLVVGAVLGAVFADRLDTRSLAIAFFVFALLAGLQLALGRTPIARRPLPGRLWTGMLGTGIGAVSSLVGIGGGSLTTPWLLWHGFTPQRSVASAAACGYPIALAGTAAFIVLGQGTGPALGYVYLPAFLAVALAGALAAPLGAALVHRSRPQWVRRLFGGFLLLTALRMLSALT
jgi:uncharacterized membrane protein YfcA